MKIIHGVFGVGGYGREVMPLVQKIADREAADVVFVVDADYKTQNEVDGVKILSFDEFLSIEYNSKYLTIAVADHALRRKISEISINNGIKLSNVVADNVVLLGRNTISEGVILSPFVTITTNCTIGRGFHANLYSYVGHDCILGDYVTFSPSVKCSGNVVIQDHVFVGTGAIIRPGTSIRPLVIGEGAIIGMGAVVTKAVPAGCTVIGNPGRIVKTKHSGLKDK
jgi:sugar O-acyltransferase (sialic acid O-acetyltransferase NeuD family)